MAHTHSILHPFLRQSGLIIIILFGIMSILASGGGGGSTPAPADTTPPSTPENLTAVVLSSTEISLSWDASTDDNAVVGYSVYRDGSPIANTPTNAYIDITLTPSTLYCYSVSSYDAATNESPLSTQVCETTNPPPDTTPPTVTSTNPTDGAIDIEYDAVITATFSESMTSSTINSSTFIVIDSNATQINGVVAYDDATYTVSFTPSDLFAYEETYTATILSTVQDLAGNPMASDVNWSFTSKAPQVSFSISGSFPISLSVTDIVTTDFNNDSNLDLAITDYNAETVSILLGDGTGVFGTKTDFATGVQPRAITYGYFDADSNIDLAIANQTYILPFPLPPGTTSILLGDGSGDFGVATSYDVGNSPMDISVGDFNGDSNIDLVTANRFSDDVSILIGSGTGSFSSTVNYSAEWSPSSVVVGDFNEDMKLDLAVSNSTPGTVSVLLGTGTGTFGSETSFASGSYPDSIKADDLDEDGHLDLIVANDGTDIVTMLPGDGTGSFSAGTPITVGQYPQTVSVADLNDDNILDLVVTTSKNAGIGDNRVYVLLGHGNGAFGTANAIYTIMSIGIELPLVTIGDFNSDNKPDLAITDSVNDRVYILLNTTP